MRRDTVRDSPQEAAVIYLITRPFVFLFKLVKMILFMPVRMFRAARDRRYRSRVKMLTKDAKRSQKAA